MDINNLLKQMTLDEKIGQCVQLPGEYYGVNGEITGPLEGYTLTDEQVYLSGSTLGVTGSDNVRKLQEKYLKISRLKIPLLFMADIIHGYETIFPVPLALASSFDPALATKVAKYAAKESYVSGVHVTFSPMVDIVRDARWGRVMESNGEDTLLSCDLAGAYVKGYQGDGINCPDTVVSCVKHFAAYGAAESGREYNTVDMSERVLREKYLPPYKAAIDAGADMVMTSFNTVNSIPASTNRWLLSDILREEMKFSGIVISDWTSILETVNHGTSESIEDAGVQAMDAGCDIDMSSPCFFSGLKAAVESGQLDVEVIDKAVLRILHLKEKLGLFEDPFRGIDSQRETKEILSEEHKLISLEAAQQSIVLLKNKDNILPINKKKKIAIVGPNALELDLNGAWSWRGHADNNVLLKSVLEKNYEILHNGERFIFEQIQDADVIIYVGGEKIYMSGEAASRSDITLPFNQAAELQQLKQFGKEVVLVNYSGRPIALSNVECYCDAIIQGWFLGTMSNQAIGSVITGEFNPSGKLPMSFPRSTGQCPIYYDALNTGRPYIQGIVGYKSKYKDEMNKALYPFGHGLNYSEIKLSNINCPTTISHNEDIKVKLTISNDSKLSGSEVIQVYMWDKVAKVARPNKQLVAYKKISIDANAEFEVDITIPFDNLKYVDLNNNRVIEDGLVELMIGLSSENTESFNVVIG